MEKEYRSVRVGGMSESSYGTATMECFKREKLGNYTVLFVGPWTPDKLRAIGGVLPEREHAFRHG